MGVMTLQAIADCIGAWAPWETAESWDNVGILVDAGRSVTGVLCALDITDRAIECARTAGASVIVSHHPVIFHPLKKLSAADLPARLIQAGVSAVCAHTNLDRASGGVCDTLAQAIGLQRVKAAGDFLRVGSLPGAVTAQTFAEQVGKALGTRVQFTCGDRPVHTVGVVSGAGGDFFEQAASAGCDCLVTGEAGHHDALDAARLGVALIAAGHHATEKLIVPVLCRKLKEAFPQLNVSAYEEADPFAG